MNSNNEIKQGDHENDIAFNRGYQTGMSAFRGKTFEAEPNIGLYLKTHFQNPYYVRTGGQGKKLKANWHNGFRAGAKAAIRLNDKD